MWAAARDEAGTTFTLLQAGADPTLQNQFGADALDVAHGEAVFFQLLSVVVAKRGLRDGDMSRYFAERDVKDASEGPWDETALTRAISGSVAGGILPLPPPPPASFPGIERSRIPPAPSMRRPHWDGPRPSPRAWQAPAGAGLPFADAAASRVALRTNGEEEKWSRHDR